MVLVPVLLGRLSQCGPINGTTSEIVHMGTHAHVPALSSATNQRTDTQSHSVPIGENNSGCVTTTCTALNSRYSRDTNLSSTLITPSRSFSANCYAPYLTPDYHDPSAHLVVDHGFVYKSNRPDEDGPISELLSFPNRDSTPPYTSNSTRSTTQSGPSTLADQYGQFHTVGNPFQTLVNQLVATRDGHNYGLSPVHLGTDVKEAHRIGSFPGIEYDPVETQRKTIYTDSVNFVPDSVSIPYDFDQSVGPESTNLVYGRRDELSTWNKIQSEECHPVSGELTIKGSQQNPIETRLYPDSPNLSSNMYSRAETVGVIHSTPINAFLINASTVATSNTTNSIGTSVSTKATTLTTTTETILTGTDCRGNKMSGYLEKSRSLLDSSSTSSAASRGSSALGESLTRSSDSSSGPIGDAIPGRFLLNSTFTMTPDNSTVDSNPTALHGLTSANRTELRDSQPDSADFPSSVGNTTNNNGTYLNSTESGPSVLHESNSTTECVNVYQKTTGPRQTSTTKRGRTQSMLTSPTMQQRTRTDMLLTDRPSGRKRGRVQRGPGHLISFAENGLLHSVDSDQMDTQSGKSYSEKRSNTTQSISPSDDDSDSLGDSDSDPDGEQNKVSFRGRFLFVFWFLFDAVYNILTSKHIRI
ncbi:unnamed protein product [Echinostoma caproni]|uniref:Protein grainyhead n=1 Tax=Echinostoma caproni TaxID=27848 RepID=A0A183AM00_9TREM|nr:unnamed protein product [Echinostoma caproni]